MMKKFVFLFTALLLVCASLVFSQMTNTEISQMILRSKEFNETSSQIINPDLVFPGQVLTFLFADGKDTSFVVSKGESQWVIIRDKLSRMEKSHGSVVDYVDPVPVIIPEPLEFSWFEEYPFSFLIAFILLIILITLLVKYYNARNENPVTAGPPQVPGGVSNTTAHERMQQIVLHRFPGTRMDIRNMRRGRLSGLAKVFYADGKSRMINLKSISVYAGEITVDNQEETIYCLQECGNDARGGTYMTGKKLIFTPDAIINKNGSEGPLPAAVDMTIAKESEVNVPDLGSEFHQHIEKSMKILGDVLKSKEEKHKVTFKVTRDALEAEIQYKYDSTSKKGVGH